MWGEYEMQQKLKQQDELEKKRLTDPDDFTLEFESVYDYLLEPIDPPEGELE